MKPEEIVAQVVAYGESHANPALVEKYSRYFKEGYDAWGLTHEQVVELRTRLLETPGMTHDLILETSLLLVRSPKYESTALAVGMVKHVHRQWTPATLDSVEKWFSLGITNWAHTDVLCSELMELFFKKGLADPGRLSEWRTAANRFQRRAAVVSLIKPMKKMTVFAPLFDFIEPMMHDPAREVHQGLGWFLREAWKKQPGPTEAFLLRFKDTAPRLIFQYATEKMTKEGKERFRKTKG